MNDNISNLIAYHFPHFYRTEGPDLIRFIEDYYKWLESTKIKRYEFVGNYNFTNLSSVFVSGREYKTYIVLNSSDRSIDVLNGPDNLTFLSRFISEKEGVGVVSKGDKPNIIRGFGTKFLQYTNFDNSTYIKVNGYVYRIKNIVNNNIILTHEDIDLSFSNVEFDIITGSAPIKIYDNFDNGNALHKSRSLIDYFDVDKTLDLYIEELAKMYLNGFSVKTKSSRSTLIKNILDFYRTKGTDRGLKMLFRLLFGEEIEIYKPFDETLAPSSSEWIVPEYLEVTDSSDLETIEGKRIIGTASGATAIVEKYVNFYTNNKRYNVLYLSNVNGFFAYGENIRVDGVEDFRPFRSVGSLNGLDIILGGENFVLGEEVDIIENGFNGKGVIRSIKDSDGSVTFNLIDGGTGYSNNALIDISGGNGINANFVIGDLINTTTISIFSDVIEDYYFTQIENDTSGFRLNISGVSGNLNVGQTFTSVNTNSSGIIYFANSSTLFVNTPRNISNTSLGGIFAGGTFGNTATGNCSINSVVRLTDWGFPDDSNNANLGSVIEQTLSFDSVTYGTISFIRRTNPGENYTIAPSVKIEDPVLKQFNISDGAGNILGNNAIVTATVDNANGIATSIKIEESGFGYSPNFNVKFRNKQGREGIANPILYGTGKEKGYSEGRTDSLVHSHIQDSFYYQAFSYEIRSGLDFSTYADTVKKLSHTAGYKMFGAFKVESASINKNMITSTISQS